MKAIISRARGGPDTLSLEDVPEPVPSEGQVLLAVHAVGVNYPDVLIIEDRYQTKPERPFSPGAEVAGVIEAVGAGVAGLQVGDRVLAMLGYGGMAEKVAVDAARCIVLPDAMPLDEAAAFVMTYGTSYHALVDRAGLKPGETLLVLGAAGGVGLAAIELGVAMGARVVAAASTQEKLDVAQASGAAAGMIYPRGPIDRDGQKALSAAFKAACEPGGADVIYDPVGGDYAEPALRSIAWKGRYLVVGFPSGIPKLPLNLMLLKGCDVLGVFWGSAVERDPARHRAAVGELFALYGEGRIRPKISQRFPLAQASAAIAALSSRQTTGKVVVMVH